MPNSNPARTRKLYASAALACIAALLMVLAACNIRTEKRADNKKVDIETPFGGIHVGTDTSPQDTGLSAYPGARLKPSQSDDAGRMRDRHSANVNIEFGNFGVRVVALDYLTDDPPDKVIGYYRNELKKYGPVLECPKGIVENKHDGLRELRCSESGREESGRLDLAVGVPERQRIVSVRPRGKGAEFALVYVQVRRGETL